MAKIDGTAAGAVAAGVLFLFAGLTGKDILAETRRVIAGQSPATALKTQQIIGTVPVGPPGGRVTGLGSVPVPANSSQRAWAAAQLLAVAAPPTPANIAGMIAWANRESPWNASPPDGAEYTHNPLNTTDQTGAVGEVNSVDVAIYGNWATGIAATTATLQGYPDILARLRTGAGFCGWSSPDFSKWSGGGYASVC